MRSTTIERVYNGRGNRMITFRGRTLTMAEWARVMDMPYARLEGRLNRLGWSIGKALLTPSDKHNDYSPKK